jgi:alpha-D-ribose 1-methylphosphonate 5-triphosphate synthase subunit PhnH
MAAVTSLASATDIAPGLADPVRDSQRVFRPVLDAMAHPGRISELPSLAGGVGKLGPAATMICLALVDYETPVWLDRSLSSSKAIAFLRFHTGAPLAEDARAAAFAVLDGPSTPLSGFRTGSDAYPEEGATVIIQVPALSDTGPFSLSGPGIDGTAAFGADSLDDAFWRERNEVNSGFPRGIDLILCAGRRIACLPRTSRVAMPSDGEKK